MVTIIVMLRVFDETEESFFIFRIYMLFNIASVALCLYGEVIAEDLETNNKLNEG